MTEVRNDIRFPITEMDVHHLNNILMSLWSKLHGDVNLSDIAKDVKTMLYTNWMQVQNEGNLDATHPLVVRFYIPPNVSKIKSTSINAITSNYRVDSSVTESSPSISTSAVVTSGPTSKTTALVERWGPVSDIQHPGTQVQTDAEIQDLTQFVPGSMGQYINMYWSNINEPYVINPQVVARIPICPQPGGTIEYAWMDLYKLQHRHNIDHTHSGSAEIEIDGHSHDLRMAVYESPTAPSNVQMEINGTSVGNAMNGSGQVQTFELPVDSLIIGGWNQLTVTASSVARITIYGILELTSRF